MLFLSDEKREAIAELCRAHGVKRLDLFGSAATDAFRPGASDVDLLVDFGDMGGCAKAHAYLDLQDGLREVLGTDVDLVMVAAVKNRQLARAIELTKQPLYAAQRRRLPGRRSGGVRCHRIGARRPRSRRVPRAIRSSVEREFILIGEAVASLRRLAPELAARITDARVIVGFRNVLTYEHAAVDDDAVYGVATEDLATLRRECASLLANVESAEQVPGGRLGEGRAVLLAAALTSETYAGAIERLAAADPMPAAVVEPAAFLTLDDARLRAIGFSRQKLPAVRPDGST